MLSFLVKIRSLSSLLVTNGGVGKVLVQRALYTRAFLLFTGLSSLPKPGSRFRWADKDWI